MVYKKNLIINSDFKFELKLSKEMEEFLNKSITTIIHHSFRRPVWWKKLVTLRALYHLRESLGRPRTVLCQTIGKLVLEQKFWVTATVLSKFRTTCHHPPGTNTVSPGFCNISNCNANRWNQLFFLSNHWFIYPFMK